MNTIKRKLGLLFHGKEKTPISLACNTCPLLQHNCPGSVYNDGCPTHAVKHFEPFHYAQLILEDARVQGNPFLLARIAGYPLPPSDSPQYNTAMSIQKNIISQIQQDYRTQETLYVEEETFYSDITEEDLPF